MKAAARIAPCLRQALRPVSVPVARVAGPSRLSATCIRFASTSTEVAEIPATPETPATEQPPPNVMYEDIKSARTHITASLAERARTLHTTPADLDEPITQPLSSLSSDTPTEPLDDGSSVALPRDLFSKPLRRDILHRSVVWYLSTLRMGNQSTKNRSTVAFSGRKLRPQKGTGHARVGDASSGMRRKGAPIHALSPRNWAQELPRKVRALGIKTALSSKLQSGTLRVVSNFNENEWQGTNDAVRALADYHKDGVSTLRFGSKKDLDILFVHAPEKDVDDSELFYRKIRNIPGVEMMSTEEVQVYHILKYRWLVLEADAIDAFAYPEGGSEMTAEFQAALEAAFEAEHDDAVRKELEMQGLAGIDGPELEKMAEQVDLNAPVNQSA